MDGKESELGLTVKRDENFSEWYTQLVTKAELADYGPVQGTMAIMPYSYAIWEKIQAGFDAMIKSAGHQNAYFPLFIPESFFLKESEHLRGFAPELFWITKEGDRELGERIAVRPTSETIIYHFLAKWIRSWRDLPMLLNQWCNVTRAEIKATKLFIRTSEFLWQEGHTAHASKDEAEREVMLILGFYREIAEKYLAIPVLFGRKSESEKFAGAVYTTTIEAMMPDGKALQLGTSHYLGENFSKHFGVSFLDKEGKTQNVHTTSWGISTRMIGALIMANSDDKGLIMPPMVAPIQVVIVPIFYSEEDKAGVMKVAEELKAGLEKKRISVRLDSRPERSPGYKFNYWELKGVPIRIEIGPRDLKEGTLVIARRDTGEKAKVKREEAIKAAGKLIKSIQKSIFKKNIKTLKEKTFTAKTYDELKAYVGRGFVRANWCGSGDCELKIKEETTATNRVIPFDGRKKGKCVVCGKETETVAYFAKAY
ncbi:MAG TPA: proline--tRNA ligase [Candidatus Saccharimonadales bacterium]|nr:proline--tRNA ligase [Candidatus Saccharimonadales bacterium]